MENNSEIERFAGMQQLVPFKDVVRIKPMRYHRSDLQSPGQNVVDCVKPIFSVDPASGLDRDLFDLDLVEIDSAFLLVEILSLHHHASVSARQTERRFILCL